MPVFYEERLNRDPRWAMSEGSRHFEGDSAVFVTLRSITKRLKAIGVPYAVVGGMALFRHGLRRFTEDVDILVRKDDLRTIHEQLDGLGYIPPFKNSKHLRDVETGVKVEFLTTGDYPGDGKAKPVAFPDPATVSFEAEEIRFVNLPTLVELKLASGMTNAGRLKDLADVQELIKLLKLPAEFSEQLNPFVRDKFVEIWQASFSDDMP
ncbi:MAG: nucleotidyltransferase family protein [Planctomycetaceae bacterium]|nr:nucleotidyltransferase family protein [Planctomycetaceae bacterium]